MASAARVTCIRRRSRTGSNVNQSPNADQKAVSFAKLRILYEIVTLIGREDAVGGPHSMNGGEVRWMRDRRRGARSSGK